MHDLNIVKQNGGRYIDSREVAELIGKRHNDLLRDIRGYIGIMEKSNVRNFAHVDFFVTSSYQDAKGEPRPCYLLSKMGCEMVANKLTGEKGILFTAVYVSKFNEMEAAERVAERTVTAVHSFPRLGEYNAAARIIVRALRTIGTAPEQIVEFLKSMYEPIGINIAVCDIGDAPQLYTAKQIAEMLGVYSINGHPHYQAISVILNENIFIDDSHKTVTTTDYGNYTGVSVQYDKHAVCEVMDWLMEYKWPREIYGFERTYRVVYRL